MDTVQISHVGYDDENFYITTHKAVKHPGFPDYYFLPEAGKFINRDKMSGNDFEWCEAGQEKQAAEAIIERLRLEWVYQEELVDARREDYNDALIAFEQKWGEGSDANI